MNAGEYIVINKHLVRRLSAIGMWSDAVKNRIIADGGSIQSQQNIPADIRSVFKTVWEIPQKALIDMAVDRGRFVCQSQSLNIHLDNPSVAKLTSLHFYAWGSGLKTGMYYLRTRPKADAIQFTVDQSLLEDGRDVAAASSSQACSISEGNCDCCGA